MPVRSAILGATLTVVVVIATVVFGASLNSLVSHPRLYGWNWNYALMAGGGAGDVPAAQSARLLDHDASVAAWSGYWFGNLQVDGRTVPVLGTSPGASVAPPVLTGHGFEGADQIVLGPGTLAQIHKVVGDTVTVRYGTTTPHRLRIVGTATMPAVGVGGVTGHASMGTGAVVPYQLLPASVRNQFDLSPTGPNAIFVRLKPGVDATTALRGLQPHRGGGDAAHQLPERGVRRAATGRDRQLPVDGLYAAAPRARADGGGGGRPRPHPHRLRPAPAPLDGHVADARVHGSPAGGERGLAVERRRGDRARRRGAARDRARPVPVGPLRRHHLRRAEPDGARSGDRGHRASAPSCSATSLPPFPGASRPARRRRCCSGPSSRVPVRRATYHPPQ